MTENKLLSAERFDQLLRNEPGISTAFAHMIRGHVETQAALLKSAEKELERLSHKQVNRELDDVFAGLERDQTMHEVGVEFRAMHDKLTAAEHRASVAENALKLHEEMIYRCIDPMDCPEEFQDELARIAQTHADIPALHPESQPK